jgi:hypothetical protein
MTLIVLTATLLSACFLDYWAYSRAFYLQPGIWMDLVHGTGSAPAQYRVGVVRSAFWISEHMHMGMRHAFTLLDMISGLAAVFLLYDLLERSLTYRKSGMTAKWFGSVAYVVLVQYYLAWLLWYQRPETLPTAMLVAILLWLWTRKNIWLDESTVGQWLTAALIFLVSAAQGVVRADMAFMVDLGMLLLCLTRLGKGLALPRSAAIVVSLSGAILAGAIQIYMMKVVYPNASYGTTPVFQLKLNFIDHDRVFPFVLFLIPYWWMLAQIAKRRLTGDAAGLGMVAGSLMFAVLWIIFGKFDEVRIFMPIALALAPLTVQGLMEHVGVNYSS